MPAGAVQLLPSDDVLITMSFDAQFMRKRQSCHTTYTRPEASTAAEGSDDVRRLPATMWSVMVEIITVLLHVAPPSLEVKASICVPSAFSIGTTTNPLAPTIGWPPTPVARSAVLTAALHVWPPSAEVLIQIKPFAGLLGSSHSM